MSLNINTAGIYMHSFFIGMGLVLLSQPVCMFSFAIWVFGFSAVHMISILYMLSYILAS